MSLELLVFFRHEVHQGSCLVDHWYMIGSLFEILLPIRMTNALHLYAFFYTFLIIGTHTSSLGLHWSIRFLRRFLLMKRQPWKSLKRRKQWYMAWWPAFAGEICSYWVLWTEGNIASGKEKLRYSVGGAMFNWYGEMVASITKANGLHHGLNHDSHGCVLYIIGEMMEYCITACMVNCVVAGDGGMRVGYRRGYLRGSYRK